MSGSAEGPRSHRHPLALVEPAIADGEPVQRAVRDRDPLDLGPRPIRSL